MLFTSTEPVVRPTSAVWWPICCADCWVMWSGRIANSEVTDTSYSCDLLVGYENQKRVEGIVPLVFDSAMNLDPSLPITVLGKISLTENGKLYLKGKSVYQSVDGSTL